MLTEGDHPRPRIERPFEPVEKSLVVPVNGYRANPNPITVPEGEPWEVAPGMLRVGNGDLIPLLPFKEMGGQIDTVGGVGGEGDLILARTDDLRQPLARAPQDHIPFRPDVRVKRSMPAFLFQDALNRVQHRFGRRAAVSPVHAEIALEDGELPAKAKDCLPVDHSYVLCCLMGAVDRVSALKHTRSVASSFDLGVCRVWSG